MPDIKQIPLSSFGNALLQRQSTFQASAESDHSAKFEKGKPADPTQNMSDEQKAEWAKQIEEHGDKFKTAGATPKPGDKVRLNDGTEGTVARVRAKDAWVETSKWSAWKEFGAFSVKKAADESDTDAKFEKGEDVPLKDMPKKLQENAEDPPPEVKALKEKMKAKKAFITDQTLDQLIDMAMESSEIEGDVTGEGWSTADRARDKWNDAVANALGRWLKDSDNMAKVDQNSRPLRRVRDNDIKGIVEVLLHHRGGAGYLYYMEAEGHGVGTWDGDWDQLFIDGSNTVDELSKHMARATKREYQDLNSAIDNAAYSASPDDDDDDGRYASTPTRERLTWDPAVRTKLASRSTEARAAAGLYGYTKKVQADCEACSRKLARKTASIARAAWNKDERVASFLQTHAKRSKSRSAKLLVAALKNLGPKVASQMDKTAGAGAANARYLDGLPGMEKLKILKHLAKHYGVSIAEIEDEVKDRDAENLFEYTATDRAMTTEIYNGFKRQRLLASKTAKTMTHDELEQWLRNIKKGDTIDVYWKGHKGKGKVVRVNAQSVTVTLSETVKNNLSDGGDWEKGRKINVPTDPGVGKWKDFQEMAAPTGLSNLKRVATDKTAATDKEASYGMYGASAKVARLGLTACASLKEAAGELSADLHRRRASSHASYTGFLGEHSKTARDGYSRMLLGFYPDSGSKCASMAPPDSVDEWLTWDE